MTPSWPELPVTPRPGSTPLFVLTGPTASGKTEIAHQLADHYGFRLLSLDSMMVYRGMEIGTAKPTPEEQERYRYAGLNVAEPGERFSTAAYLSAIVRELDDRPAIAVGGTGLYLKAIMQGFDASAPADPDRRAGLERMSVAELQNILDRDRIQALEDPGNPRRLIRAVEQQLDGLSIPDSWTREPPAGSVPVPVLQWPTETLNNRIRERVERMLEKGLLEEVRGIEFSGGTSAQAIGYAEALGHLRGELSREETVERITIRTRQYAKRQRTWFRNQMCAAPIELPTDPHPAFSVASCWKSTGPIWFNREHE